MDIEIISDDPEMTEAIKKRIEERGFEVGKKPKNKPAPEPSQRVRVHQSGDFIPEGLGDYDGDAKNETIMLPDDLKSQGGWRLLWHEREGSGLPFEGLPPAEAGPIWKGVKNIVRKAISTFRDFMGVAQRNGFVVLGPGPGSMASVEAAERMETEERGRYLSVPEKDAVVPEMKGGYEPEQYDDTFEVAGDEDDGDWVGDPNLDPNIRLVLVSAQPSLKPGEKPLKGGNLKLDKQVGVWNLPCQSTCPESTEFCRKFCYARKAETPSFRKHVLPARWRRLKSSLDPGFVEMMIKAIHIGEFRTVRIHESGDFYNEKYFYKWIDIAKGCPEAQFVAFTKAYKILDKFQGYKGKPENIVFNGSAEVSTEYSIQEREALPKDEGEKVTKYRNVGETIRKFFSGSTGEKIDSFMKNPNVAGLAIIIPKGATLEDTLWALGLDEVVGSDEVFICPYKEVVNGLSMGCGNEEDGLCPFCWLPRGARESIESFENGISVHGARHVAFHQH